MIEDGLPPNGRRCRHRACVGEWNQAGSDSTPARSAVWTRQTSGRRQPRPR